MTPTAKSLVALLLLLPVHLALPLESSQIQQQQWGESAPEFSAIQQQQQVKAEQSQERPGEPISIRKFFAEFIAMALFVIFGCGSAMSVAKEPGWVLQVSLAFGLAITILAYTVGHYSGAQVNCAVTFGLMLAGQVGWGQGILNIVFQLLGSIFGASVLRTMYPMDKDLTGGLGTNAVAEGWGSMQALFAEFMGTFLLMYVVLETAVNGDTQANASFAPIAIGLAVFLAHSVLIPIDGCSINPTRSFGPAFVHAVSGGGKSQPFRDMWVFWLGPLAGAAAAYGIYTAIN